MIKRISCRVVDSVPLSKSGSALRRTSRSDDKGCRSGDTIAANVSGPSNSVVYTFARFITLTAFGTSSSLGILNNLLHLRHLTLLSAEVSFSSQLLPHPGHCAIICIGRFLISSAEYRSSRPAQAENILAANWTGIHRKFYPHLPIISLCHSQYHIRQKRLEACSSTWRDLP